MIMKMYSYVSVNGYLQWIYKRSIDVFAELNGATARVGGLEQALRDATSMRAQAQAASQSAETPVSNVTSTPMETCTPDPEGVLMKSFTDVKTAAALRQRLALSPAVRRRRQSLNVVQLMEAGAKMRKLRLHVSFHTTPMSTSQV